MRQGGDAAAARAAVGPPPLYLWSGDSELLYSHRAASAQQRQGGRLLKSESLLPQPGGFEGLGFLMVEVRTRDAAR